eukprot:SAG31_NODE_4890_length_2882_cov_3.387352_2_plen_215_part_00
MHLTEQMSLPRQLEQDDSGFLVPEDVAMLEQLEAEAVKQRDYRLAAQLRDTIDVLTPQRTDGRQLTLADFAPQGLSAQLSCFWESGFVVLHGLLQGDDLKRARAAWLDVEPVHRAKFMAAADGVVSAHGEVGNDFAYGIPNLMELDDVFIDLMDHPKLVDVVQHVAGAGGLDDFTTPATDRRYHGVMRLGDMSGNIIVSETPNGKANELGYTMW